VVSTKSSKYNNQLIAKAEREIKQRRSEMRTKGSKSYKDLMNAYNDGDYANQSVPDFKASPFNSKVINENTFFTKEYRSARSSGKITKNSTRGA
jgi:hypothetical protein